MSDPAILVDDVFKSYRMGASELSVLRGVSLTVDPGQFVAVVGASGSGKSTLLHLIGLLDRPDSGRVVLDGRDVSKLSRAAANRTRCNDVGFVFQFYHLLSELSVLENAMLPAKVATSTGRWLSRRKVSRADARKILDALGLSQRLRHRPKELSGGERQRVAIARALINGPKVLLADEPTGNLDSVTGSQIMDVLHTFNKSRGQTVLMVTHDAKIAAQADRVLTLIDGALDS